MPGRLENWFHDRGVPLMFLLCVLIGAVALGVRAARSQAPDFDSWLVLIIDTSGSVSSKEYIVQRDGYVQVLLDPMIAEALDRTAVCIIEFGTFAKLVVDWTDVRGAGAAYREHTKPLQGSTCVWCGLELALKQLEGKSGKLVIDISGDGYENVKTFEAVNDLRDAATLLGIEINTLALLVEKDNGFYGSYSGVGESKVGLENWYAELATGFAMAIETLDDLARALRRKLFAEIVTIETYER